MSAADGTVLRTTKVVDHGPNAFRYNLVFLSEGYRVAELARFAAEVDEIIAILSIVIRPFRHLWANCNVFRVDVESAESGVDDPLAGITRRTFFDARFLGPPNPAHWMGANSALVLRTCRAEVPTFSVPILLANASRFGGMQFDGMAIATLQAGPEHDRHVGRAAQTVAHEIGHVLGLADEYASDNGCAAPEPHLERYQGAPIEAPNVFSANDPNGPPWIARLNAASPTVSNPDCRRCGPRADQLTPAVLDAIGRFEGAHRRHCGVFRSEFDCIMRGNRNQFCNVCMDRIEALVEPHGPRLEARGSSTWQGGSTRISPFRIGDDVFLLRWRPTNQPIDLELGIARVKSDASGIEVTLSSFTERFRLLVPLNLPAPFIFQHGRFDATAVAFDSIGRLFPVRADGGALLAPTFTGPVKPDLITAAVAFELGGETFLFLYSSIVGEFNAVRVRADGTGLDTMVTGFWDAGLLGVASVPGVNNGVVFIGYELGGGTKALHFEMVGTSMAVTARATEVGRPRLAGFTSISSLAFHGENLLLFYIAAVATPSPSGIDLSGTARFERVLETDTGSPTTLLFGPARHPTLSPGLVLAPFDLGGSPHLVSYAPLTGEAFLDRIT
jgi:hypothetical protein